MRLYLPNNLLKRPDADLSDLTASQRAGAPYWDPEECDVLVIPLDPEPSAAEQELIRRRLVTTGAEDEDRYAALLGTTPTSSFESLWLATELARYEPPTTEGDG